MKIETDVKLDNIAGLLCSAFEGGIGYWAKIVDYKEPEELVDLGKSFMWQDSNGEKVTPKHIYYPLSKGGAVIIKDIEDDEGQEYFVDLETVERGLKLMQEKYPHHFGDFISENYDAITGDVLIQLAVFSELVYG